MPTIKYQFREPIPVNENSLENDDEGEDFNATRVELIDFSRPSDFRQKAVAAKRAGHSVSGGGDSHLNASMSHKSDESEKGKEEGSSKCGSNATSEVISRSSLKTLIY